MIFQFSDKQKTSIETNNIRVVKKDQELYGKNDTHPKGYIQYLLKILMNDDSEKYLDYYHPSHIDMDLVKFTRLVKSNNN